MARKRKGERRNKMKERNRTLINIRAEHFIARPKWNVVSEAQMGDVLVNGRRVVGVVYENAPECVKICYPNYFGNMVVMSFTPAPPSRLRFEQSTQRAVLFSKKYVGYRILVDSEFWSAESSYNEAVRVGAR